MMVAEEHETPEYRLWKASRVQQDQKARETLEKALLVAERAWLDAVAALEEWDREHSD